VNVSAPDRVNPDNLCNTALHKAATKGYIDVMKCLLVGGANKCALNTKGETAADLFYLSG
jgi:ankyrin repeat protein